MVTKQINRVTSTLKKRVRTVICSSQRRYSAICFAMITLSILSACDLVPAKPEAVFDLYRQRMKAGQIAEARQLLSGDSLKLVLELETNYKLDQTPESIALLNALDPVTAPTTLRNEDNVTVLQARTIKGSARTIKITRSGKDAPWKVDISSELNELKTFLKGREALDRIREQAGEYAASWKAFHDQINQMRITEQPETKPGPAPHGEKQTPEHKSKSKTKKRANKTKK